MKGLRVAETLLRLLLWLSLIFETILISGGCALGWMRMARAGENWPLEFVHYGEMLLVGIGVLLGAAVCAQLRLRIPALAAAVPGILLILIPAFRVAAYADEKHFFSSLMQMPAGTLYRTELLPNLIPFVCIVVLAVLAKKCRQAAQSRVQEPAAVMAETAYAEPEAEFGQGAIPGTEII